MKQPWRKWAFKKNLAYQGEKAVDKHILLFRFCDAFYLLTDKFHRKVFSPCKEANIENKRICESISSTCYKIAVPSY